MCGIAQADRKDFAKELMVNIEAETETETRRIAVCSTAWRDKMQ